MKTPVFTKSFKKDYKNNTKSGINLNSLNLVFKKLLCSEKLEEKYKDHKLSGKWSSHRECHVRPNLLLIYKIVDNKIHFERLGSHSDFLNNVTTY
ncbi:hypothetical protein A2483_05830 [Candidatus Peregrinibacteria bacterium RIFOXYC2_FULL_33_13]|nr:MAG: hypothetical protein UR27_C0015G0007 [Candidatus Peregrinibacteria bacterium GW2011_GWA2_33_10]KKP39510.1 MAG: damage inducible protein [Candidatus Peregrinibacteria bacterium GW2011_GWC2_33_13]OGJ49888.1 MAG: hypothetical protein A2229_01120 [Candidatus Peregrinibacteria bacterium RIFOXYA2_FULL_33_7]OGJ54803.1 MAG: hypothetical protein A2483_05830 [Candidatus Peregrinibacteria bacterium RIFOXYC2_FULL_33_13]